MPQNRFPVTSCHSVTTMELFPFIMAQRNPTAMDFLSQQPAFSRHSEVPTIVKPSLFKFMEKEPKASQLTIFYAGQVVVFDDFPADKVEEIMSLVSKRTPQQSKDSSAYSHTHKQHGNHPFFVPNITLQIPSSFIPIACDLPIARKVSLHRFLERRKDRFMLVYRIAAKAPYKTNNPNSASRKLGESMSWLGLVAKSTQI
ncbi:hypothetical protein Fmac_013268 [Flemingia macrophylla]|uniref:Protein TIFY n=1 Tax=Flemingia macrophylla TaxID=520843 RepID=A0ABD1MTI4_9FABA